MTKTHKKLKREKDAIPAVTWDKPKEISDLDMAFPANVIGTLLPPNEQIPEEFWSRHHPCSEFVSLLFFKGGRLPAVKQGIDMRAANRHMQAVLGSYEPKHEHKIAGAAWLLSQWFELPKQRSE